MVAIEEYEKSLNLEDELQDIGRKVAFDVLGRAGFKVWSFPGSEREAEKMRSALGEDRCSALLEYIARLNKEGEAQASPDILAEKDEVFYAVSLVLNDAALLDSRRRALRRAQDFMLVPVVFRAAVEVSIPYSSLELLQE
ncbi:hypothetical protein [Candidatus Pyrohabitans sp.]